MAQLTRDDQGNPIPVMRPGVSVRIAVGAASAASAALSTFASVVRLKATTDCHVAFGDTAASVTDLALSAGETEYFAVRGGSVIRVIRAAADGFLNVTEMT